MKRLLVATLAVAFPVLASAEVAGVYRTQPASNGATANVKIAPCGNAICGTIVSTSSGDGVGTKIVWDMQPAGENSWKNGKIMDPSDESVYSAKMSLSGNTLKVSGCVAGGLICKSQSWTRVN